MTAADDRREIGRRPPPQGGPAPHHRPTSWTDNIGSPGCCTWRWSAARSRTQDHRHRHRGRPTGRPTSSRSSPAPSSATTRRVLSAWPVTADQKTPTTCRCAVDRVAFAGEIVAVVVARTRRRGRATPPSSSTSSTSQLPAVLDLKEAAPTDGSSRTRTSARTSPRSGSSIRRARHRRRRRRGDREGARRRHRHRARVPPAAADPRLHGAALGRRRPDRRADHHVVLDPDPAHRCGSLLAATTGVPESQDPGDRARRRRRVRRQAADHAGGVARCAWPAKLGKPVQVDRDPRGVAGVRPPRPRPEAEPHPGRDEGRHGHRPQGRPARRHGRLRGARRRGIPVLGAWMFNGIYKFDAYRFTCTGVLTNKTLGRRLPRRRPAGGDVRHRAAHGRARRRGRRGPARDPRDELDQARGVPVHHGRRHDLRLRQLRGRDRARRWSCSATTSCGPSRSSGASRGDPVQLGIGISTFTEMCGLAPSRVLGALNYGAGGWEHADRPDAADRQGRGGHRRLAARPGPRDGVVSQIVADRLGVPFEDVEVLHGDTRSSHSGMDTYGSRSLAVGGVAWSRRPTR